MRGLRERVMDVLGERGSRPTRKLSPNGFSPSIQWICLRATTSHPAVPLTRREARQVAAAPRDSAIDPLPNEGRA